MLCTEVKLKALTPKQALNFGEGSVALEQLKLHRDREKLAGENVEYL